MWLVLLLLVAPAFASVETVSINGAGATFPYPLYSKWFSEFRKLDPRVELNYQSIGSGGGIRQLLEKTIDFGASDAPMKDEQLAKANPPIYHFPMIMGAVVLTYNLPGVTEELRLTPELVAELFLGKIYYWNDPKIPKELLGMVPDKNIVGKAFAVWLSWADPKLHNVPTLSRVGLIH